MMTNPNLDADELEEVAKMRLAISARNALRDLVTTRDLLVSGGDFQEKATVIANLNIEIGETAVRYNQLFAELHP